MASQEELNNNLFDVARIGDVKRCQLLIEQGAIVHATDWFGWTPLHLAASEGHPDVCRLLLERGASVNAATNRYGITPLHDAAANGHDEVCQLLIQADANVNAADIVIWTPLHSAAWCNHADVCRLLIDRGANINAITRNNETPLDLAISNHAVGVLECFYLDRVVNFHQPDHTGQMPWDRLTAEQRQTLAKAMEDHHEKFGILQTRGLPNELARLVMGYL